MLTAMRLGHRPAHCLIGICLSLLSLAGGQGNPRCWAGHFTYESCCNASFVAGNPDCWDKNRYTYRRCCLTTDEPLPPAHPVNPRASKSWRIVCGKDLGGWMIHELVFYSDQECKQRIRKYARTIDSGHRKGFQPTHAFDQWVKATDEYFWYSNEAGSGEAWLGLELVRPTEVKCVGLWHNNIPDVPVSLQRWLDAKQQWLNVQQWPKAQGGEWAMLSVEGPVMQDVPAASSEL
mmetsp:Transcript_35278/g.112220  ORF Transcript_35278/g.112220 Transcript_35278/m.112220 type:complete len:234 (+) Transcript_35278:194-895(+)